MTVLCHKIARNNIKTPNTLVQKGSFVFNKIEGTKCSKHKDSNYLHISIIFHYLRNGKKLPVLSMQLPYLIYPTIVHYELAIVSVHTGHICLS